MTDKEINIAIAEFCGWKIIPNGEYEITGEPPEWDSQRYHRVPSYTTDLNAIHLAEEKLCEMDYSFRNTFCSTLEWILEDEVIARECKNDPNCIPDVYPFEMIHATARQRAEALLRTIGKWRGE